MCSYQKAGSVMANQYQLWRNENWLASKAYGVKMACGISCAAERRHQWRHRGSSIMLASSMKWRRINGYAAFMASGVIEESLRLKRRSSMKKAMSRIARRKKENRRKRRKAQKKKKTAWRKRNK
jgi:hypothetical protein